MARYVFVVGGVMSGIGKGITTASVGNILKSYGYRVTAIKIDPYINVDAGTMNPVEHGEVFVTDDGLECDQDIGNYERFLDQNMYRLNYMTTGAVYQSVITRERNLFYQGKCVEVVPHIPEEVIARITQAGKKTKSDFVLVEIGGTVGEYQNLLFLEAARMLKLRHPKDVLFIMVSYLPVPGTIGEMKTKPTQHATRSLNSAGIQPDIIVARAPVLLDRPRKQKIAVFCNINEEDVISAPDIQSVYEVPINFARDKISERIFLHFGIRPRAHRNGHWNNFVRRARNAKKEVRIGIVGKYFATGKFTLSDSYISVIEAIKHSAWRQGCCPIIDWLAAESYENSAAALLELKRYDGIIVPGGFGSRGVEGKIKVIHYARTHHIPYLGICYGMQLAVIEFARSLAGMPGANSTEIDPKTPFPVIGLLEEQETLLKEKKYGGSMRLGSYRCEVRPKTKSMRFYRERNITERHRHRYELNNKFRNQLEQHGLAVAGIHPQKNLVEIIELPDHPFFVGTQFHPEFKSRPFHPHPLFNGLIMAAKTRCLGRAEKKWRRTTSRVTQKKQR